MKQDEWIRQRDTLIDLLIEKRIITRQELADQIERAFPGDLETAEDTAYTQSALLELLEKNGVITREELLRAHNDRKNKS